MFEIRVKEEFEAAHRVAGYPGKCDRMHGHSWIVEAVVRGRNLDDLGMLVDFKAVKGTLKEILDELDHRYLNELEPFATGMNPTAENLAKHIYGRLAGTALFAENENASLAAITVWESPRSSVTYFPEG
ncbi:MAG: 6-carboxytetrahydropterin synthase QueD [Selenomonadaceae bacterium]|nr:6-carboxytetrahydropterin synthase QueD [Selenomonadaceae bacterium]